MIQFILLPKQVVNSKFLTFWFEPDTDCSLPEIIVW